jgi:dTDP-4-dehydrorhamnose 3,5-epimerase
MTFTPLTIPDIILITPRVFSDSRGFFMETFQASVLRQAGLPADFAQDNESCSRRGVLRGLHYQLPPHEQGKLVRVARGRAWDVAVDIRPGSPTFGKWAGTELSAVNHAMLWIPPGFAHGFVALEDDTLFLYKCTRPYSPAAERGIRWNDPDLAIAWPGEVSCVSAKDEALPLLRDVRDA